MQKMTVNDILEHISFLPAEDQYVIAEIISKRVRDLRRRQLVQRAREAEEKYKSGTAVNGSVPNLMKAVGDD
jgi:hypothetical protein